MADLGTVGGFRLVQRLAAGATSEVFLALPSDGGTGRDPVVVKRLHSRFASDPDAVQWLRREADVLARLHHSSVPALLHTGEEGGAPYLVLERAPGASLSALLAREPTRRPLPVGAACGIAVQLGSALHHLHELRGSHGELLGAVHRDVAPDNVLVASDGRVTLVDFGLVAMAADLDTRPRGSPGHMAPEQVLGRAVDRRADVFALGVLFYELSVGRNPYGATAVARTTAVVERDAPPPSSLLAGYPPALDAIVLAALDRDVERRPATAADWVARLEAYCEQAGLCAELSTVAAWTAQTA